MITTLALRTLQLDGKKRKNIVPLIQPQRQCQRQSPLQPLQPRKMKKLFPSRRALIKKLTIPMSLYWLAPQAEEYISPKRKLTFFPGAAPNSLPLNCLSQCFGVKRQKKGVLRVKERNFQLDPNRLAAVREHTERMFPNEVNWPTVKKAINEKCRMVRNNRCTLWAGIRENHQD